MLIPFYFMVGMWGSGRAGPGDDQARHLHAGRIVLHARRGRRHRRAGRLEPTQRRPLNFTFSALRALPLPHASQDWIFLCFAFAFLVKMPLVPFHGWLADGYKSMPIPAVAVFSGVVSKVAAYGFLRIVLPLFPYASVHFQTLMLLIALVSIIWGTLVAFTTPDARMVVAYSSVAQLSFITLGIFSLRPTGGQGALLQMLNHGLVTAPLFFIVAAAAARAGGSELLADMGGIAFRAPILAALALIVTLATLAMPGSSNFVGEFMILLGVFQAKLAISVIAFAGVVGAAVYALRLYITAFHNRDRAAGRLARARAGRRRRDRPDRADHPGPRLLSPVRPAALGALGARRGRAGPGAGSGRAAAAERWRCDERRHRRPSAAAHHHIVGPYIDWRALSPFIVLTAGGLVVLLVGLLRAGGHPPSASCRR